MEGGMESQLHCKYSVGGISREHFGGNTLSLSRMPPTSYIAILTIRTHQRLG